MKIRFCTLVATSVFGLTGYASPVLAQNAQTASPATDPSTAEVIVTARRRAERLTDVPISITAISGAALASKGIVQVDDLQQSTPGRRSNSQYEIRGITTIESLITEDAAVGVYVNDVYRARPTGTNQSFYDIADIQVLYGPQGTLFGRNSTGGAILINTNRPTKRLEESIEAGYGNYDRYEVTGVVNVPLSDMLQVRVAGQRIRSDGYVTNVNNGGKLGGTSDYSGRVSVLYGAGTRFENLTVGSVYVGNDQGTPQTLYGYRSSTVPNQYGQVPALAAFGLNSLGIPAFNYSKSLSLDQVANGFGTSLPLAGGGAIPLTGLSGYLLQGTTLQNSNAYERPRNYSVSNTTTFELSDTLTIKNIIGYNYVKLDASTDFDGTSLDLIDTYYHTTNKQFSDEFQLQGRTPKLNWVVGALYFREHGLDYQPSVQFLSSFSTSSLLGTNRSIGFFGQGTYKLTDKLSLTGGARYTLDRREVRYFDLYATPPGVVSAALANNGGFGVDLGPSSVCSLSAGVANDGPCAIQRSKDFRQPSWTASVDYKPTPDTLLYVAHRHGYRSGGFNSRISPSVAAPIQIAQTQAFPVEKINDVEIGAKGVFHFGEVIVKPRIAMYYDWYSQIQKQVTDFIGNNGVTIIQDAGDARVKGLESELNITPARALNISGFFGYVDGHYKNFPDPRLGFPTINSVPFATSKYTAGATLSLTPIDNARDGRVTFSTNYSYRSSYYGDNSLPDLDPEARIPAQYSLNFDLDWANIAGSHFSASAFIRNATNSFRYQGVFDLVPSFGLAVASVAPPRTYGFTVKYAFGN